MLFDILTCAVAIAGDVRQIVYIGESRDLTWPEVIVIRSIHGDHSVTKIEVVDEREINPDVERQRLALKYGDAIVGRVFPGYSANLPGRASDHVPRFDDEVEEVRIIRRPKGSKDAEPAKGKAKARDVAPAPEVVPAQPLTAMFDNAP